MLYSIDVINQKKKVRSKFEKHWWVLFIFVIKYIIILR
jgi:hypothetical protein